MKTILRTAAVAVIALATACTSPYQAQMGALNQAYNEGRISQKEYDREMTNLSMADAGWQQSNANAATTAAVVGVAALGVAAIANQHDHHHHGYYRPRYYYRPHHHW